jgi:hypothetical protein
MPSITSPTQGHRTLLKISTDSTVSQKERLAAIKAIGNMEFMRLKIRFEVLKQRRPKKEKPNFGL